VINAKSPLPINTKLHIYRAYIRPVLSYTVVVWTANLSKVSWNTLGKVQSTTLRSLSRVQPFANNQAIRNSTKITTIKNHIQSDTEKITNKFKHSPHEYLADITNRPSPKELHRRTSLQS